MDEFRARVLNQNPHIIGITESKPKRANFNPSMAELKIKGYKLFHNSLVVGDGTRVCGLYIKEEIEAREVQINSDHKDCIWVEVKMIGGDKLLIGCIYRGPNMNKDDNRKVRELIVKAADQGHSHLLIMGDFNLPKINWTTWTSQGQDGEDEDSLFIESFRDAYLYQHVQQHTRVRGSNDPSTIDLILSNEEGMVSELEHQSPLGRSDHATLVFKFHCYNTMLVDSPTKFQFNRGDYNGMRKELAETNWDEKLNPDAPVNTQWDTFAKIVTNSMEKFIPRKKANHNRKKMLTPLDNKAIRKIKKKHRAWNRFIESRESHHYHKYCKLKNQVRNLTRKARINQEKQIAEESKGNPKKFWQFAKSQTKTREGISNLKTDEGEASTDTHKAEILLNQFSSVFTTEPDGEVPKFPLKDIEHMIDNIVIEVAQVKEKLKSLNRNKSAYTRGCIVN